MLVGEEKRSLTRQVLGGSAVEVQHNRASERNTLVGKTTAGKRPRAALVVLRRLAFIRIPRSTVSLAPCRRLLMLLASFALVSPLQDSRV